MAGRVCEFDRWPTARLGARQLSMPARGHCVHWVGGGAVRLVRAYPAAIGALLQSVARIADALPRGSKPWAVVVLIEAHVGAHAALFARAGLERRSTVKEAAMMGSVARGGPRERSDRRVGGPVLLTETGHKVSRSVFLAHSPLRAHCSQRLRHCRQQRQEERRPQPRAKPCACART